jgi:tungstate transport system permease protein
MSEIIMETILDITLRSLAISGTATLLAALWSAPIGIFLGLKQFRGRIVIKGFFNTLLGIPTVALGLVLYLIFSRSGPLGFLHLLYTPVAIIIGQAILITPITVSFITNAIESVNTEIKDLAKTLGASETQASFAVLRESMSGALLAVTASFNRAIAELGVAVMLGANIRGVTRVLTTTIALETTRGEIELGISLTIILLLILAVVNIAVNLVQRYGIWRR